MWKRGSRHDEPLFLVEDYEIGTLVTSLKNFDCLHVTQVPYGQISFEGEEIYRGPRVNAFGREWELLVGTVDNEIYKIALFRSGADSNEVRLDVMAVFGACKSLYGDPDEDDGAVAVWDAADGNVLLQTNAVNPRQPQEECYVHVFLTSSKVGSFRVR